MSKKVLLVDDARVSRMIIGKAVKKLGHEVIGEAENGELGFEAYKELKPDVVLSDLEMPVLDGMGMAEKILDFDSEANVVMITSVVNAQLVSKLMSLNIVDVLKKPITDAKLEKVFNELS